MKTKFFMMLGVVILSSILIYASLPTLGISLWSSFDPRTSDNSIPQAFASCIVNEDWTDAPCLDTIANGRFDQDDVDKWADYYLYKGSEFMKEKHAEMRNAIGQERLKEWVDESDQNRNVWSYYYFSGRAPPVYMPYMEFDIIDVVDIDYAFEEHNAITDSNIIAEMGKPQFTGDLLSIVSKSEKTPRISFSEFSWSSDDSFLIYEKFQNCDSMPIQDCKWYSFFKQDLKGNALPQEIILEEFERLGLNHIKLSPDDKKLAFAAPYDIDGKIFWKVFIYGLEDERLIQVTDDIHINSHAWMPDGNLMYNMAVSQNVGSLLLVDPEGNFIEKLYEGTPNMDQIDVSPDGKKIVFHETTMVQERSPPPMPGDFDSPGAIKGFNLETKDFFDIPIGKHSYSKPQWSPDGKFVYYMGTRPDPEIIGKVTTDGATDQKIFQDNEHRQYWSAEYALNSDASKIVFSMRYVDEHPSKTIFVADLKNPSPFLLEESVSEKPSEPQRNAEKSCGSGTVYSDGLCVVVEDQSYDDEIINFQAYLFGMFILIVALPISGIVYWIKNKRFRNAVLPVLVLLSVLVIIALYFGVIPNSIA